MRSRRRLAFLALISTVVLIAGCGARLSAKQRALALQQGGGGTTVGNGATGTTGGTGSTGSAGTAGTAGSAGTTGTGTTSNGGTGTTGATGTVTPPKGGGCTATSANNGGKTDTGLTATTINVANISDISGPVPGLFKSAEEAGKAFELYYNSTNPSGICGRQLHVDSYDSQTNSGGNRTATEAACSKDFALVGGISAYDDGGASVVESCKIPDVPAAAVTGARQRSSYTYAAESTNEHYISSAIPDYFKGSAFGDASKHAAFVYIDLGAAKENAPYDIKAYESDGFQFGSDTYPVPVQSATTQGFKPYVQKMKQHHVKFVQFLGAYQEAASLAQAMQQSSFKPVAYLLDPTGYNPQYISLAQSAGNGTYIYDPALPLTESNAELQTYTTWLQRAGFSDPPTFFGQFAWSAMRLFTQLAAKVGPHLTRAAMVGQLKQVLGWTDLNMHASFDVGKKISGKCLLFLQVNGSNFVRKYPSSGYACGRLIYAQ